MNEQKFLERNKDTGLETEVRAVSVGGTLDQAGKIPALGADGRFSKSMMPVGFEADVYVGPAGEAIDAGNLCYVNAQGQIRRASAAAAGVPAQGFVLESAQTGAQLMIYFDGRNTALAGLEIGSRYYLSDSAPGGITKIPVEAAAGKKHQFLGRAVTATTLAFEYVEPIILAD